MCHYGLLLGASCDQSNSTGNGNSAGFWDVYDAIRVIVATFFALHIGRQIMIFDDYTASIEAPLASGILAREWEARLINTFLVALDDIRNDDDHLVVVVGATNVKDHIDRAILRPGRLDTHVFVDKPGQDARRTMIEQHLQVLHRLRNRILTSTIYSYIYKLKTCCRDFAIAKCATNELCRRRHTQAKNASKAPHPSRVGSKEFGKPTK